MQRMPLDRVYTRYGLCLSVLLSVGPVLDMCCQCSLLIGRRNPGIDTPYVCVYYMFRPIVAIIRYIEPLQSPFLLSGIRPYSGQCLHNGSVFYRYVVYLILFYVMMCIKC
jgi:hypothetical protein